MTKQEAILLLNKIEYKYISFGLLHSELFTYKPENLQVLRDCQKEIPELKIYESEKKFRLITEFEQQSEKQNETPF